MSELVDAALAWHDEGFCILPAGKGKIPALSSWLPYQTEMPTREQVERWAATADGIGMMTGAISGNVEMLEIEGSAVELLTPFLKAVAEASGVLLAKLMTYVEVSPRGGYHWLYRVEGETVAGNTKLAGSATHETWIETRGHRGWTVLAPSGGIVSPVEGGSWRVAEGSPGVVATMTSDERDLLHRVARTFNEAPAVTVEHREARTSPTGELTPGQDYEARHDWAELLEPEGWTFDHQEGETGFWLRPGKKRGEQHSATTNYDGNDNLYVFTSSTSFPQRSSWTKFGFYAHLHHGDDWSAAARELRAKGYGSPARTSTAQAESRAMLSLIQGGQAPTTSGANALAPREESSSPATAFSFTDDGNARAFVLVESPRLRFCPERRAWLAWEGNRWAWLPGDGAAIWAMRELVQAMPAEDDVHFKHKVKSLSQAAISRAVKLAEADPRMQLHLSDLDAEPYELNTPSGVVDLLTAELHESTPDGLHTRLTGVAVDFESKCPRWLAFLAYTFNRDQEMIDFVQRLLGYAATGKVTHHVLPFLHGSGANGKSVFMDVALAVLGEYAAPAQSDLLLSTQIHESFVAQLQGLRLVVCNEVGPTAKFNEQRVKQFTGGDPITSRRLRQEPITFDPTHTLFVVGNHKPRVTAGGDSIWRRLRLVGFTRTVPPEERVVGLTDQLIEEEGPAILAWIVRGAIAVKDVGLGEPASVLEATTEYEEEEDHLGRFIEERVRFGGGDYVRMQTGDLYGAYESWCFSEGVEASQKLPNNVFGREMRSRGAGTARAGGRRFLTNVSLMSPEEIDPIPPRPTQLDFLPAGVPGVPDR